MTSEIVKEQLKHLPKNPGVYLMKDVEGTILYVGKANNLRSRVRSYFTGIQNQTPKTQKLVSHIHDIDFYITNSEQEALILEYNLIRRYQPHYNIGLKDDKSYPYLKIPVNEDWPRVYFTRNMEEDGGRYFGPFSSARSVRQTLKVLNGIFPFRSCSRTITGTSSQPCLEYHIHRCLAPCTGMVNKQEYTEVIKQVILFLEGKQDKIVKQLESQMKKASEEMDFEKAAILRDQIQSIQHVIEGQKIATIVKGEEDVIAFAADDDRACVQVFFIRSGRLIGRESYVLRGTSSEEPEQIMSSFIKQFYGSASYIPPLLLLQYPVEEKELIENWLQSRRGSKVRIQVPQRGHKKQLMNTVIENAEQGLVQLKIKQQTVQPDLMDALAEIEDELELSHLPSRIECYDISNIQGKAAVGSMVVFEEGKPKPSQYRRFKINTVTGADDYAMLQEVIKRRFKRTTVESNKDSSNQSTWAIIPDLVLIDGGKGQLNSVVSALREVGFDGLPVVGLAKQNEEIFIPGKKEAIKLPETSPGLHLLQRVRDEAHRFAIGYHQRIRRRETLTSIIDGIPGIGPNRKRTLIKQFGSLKAIREASIEELAATKGITKKQAQKIKEYI